MVPIRPPEPGDRLRPGGVQRVQRCVEICRSDVLMPNPEKGQPPIVLIPTSAGTAAPACSNAAAGGHHHAAPLNQSISVVWKRVATGEVFRLGMLNPPPPTPGPAG